MRDSVKVTFIAFGLLLLYSGVRRLTDSSYRDSKEERELAAIPVLNHYCDSLQIILKVQGHVGEEDMKNMLDPWRNRIKFEYENGVIMVLSAGPDAKFNTSDDIKVERRVE